MIFMAAWADDFWGSHAWAWWEGQLRQALPAHEYPIVDLPPDHPLFHSLFDVDHTPRSRRSGSGRAAVAGRRSVAPTV